MEQEWFDNKDTTAQQLENCKLFLRYIFGKH